MNKNSSKKKIKVSDVKANKVKQVYVSKENYQHISQLVGNDKDNIYEYLDRVLAKHFTRYGEAITQLLGEKCN